MKARTLFFMIVLLLAVSVSLADDVEKCYGTWVNPKYDDNYMKSSIYVIKSDGTWEVSRNTIDKNPNFSGTFRVTDSWIDSEGNLYFKIAIEYKGYGDKDKIHNYELWRLSNTGETFEIEYTNWDYPTEFHVDSYNYRIYYRQ
jgi:hypothetical protein